jgi:predicted Zn finger-like uncharacterized protein
VLTQCPGCQTVFRVTGAILRAAHGQVRCGRCAHQFDAIAHLLDQDESELTADSNVVGAMPTPESGMGGVGHEDIVLEGHRIEISGVYDRLSPEDGQSHLERDHVIEEFNIDSEQWENPFTTANDHRDDNADDRDGRGSDIGNEAPSNSTISAAVAEDPITEIDDIETELNGVSLAGDLASLDARSEDEPLQSDETEAIGHHNDDTRADGPRRTVIKVERADIKHDLTPDDVLLAPADPPRWPWLLASLMLCLLLGGQALHHWRTTLARHPTFGPVLMRAYQTLGQSLTPNWQLTAYNIKQWGIVSDPSQPGTLRVRASVTNTALFAQPYPVLRLVLEDRFGARVGQRDFKPDEYTAPSPRADRLLAANAAANIDLAIVDPGPDAVGFQFDSCLQESNGFVCAHDLNN